MVATGTLLIMGTISYSRRLMDLAQSDPDRKAITCGEHTLSKMRTGVGGQSPGS